MSFWPFNRDRKDKKPGTDLIVPDAKGQFGDACMPGMNVIPDPITPRDWSPRDFGVKIMVSGNLHDIRRMSRSVMDVQTGMKDQFAKDHPDTNVLFSVCTFLDGCRHDTGWSANPADIGSSSTRWHCHQSNTLFREALDEMRLESQSANIVLLVGERFNDDLAKTIESAAKLYKDRGTRVFCITGKEGEASEPFLKIAEAGHGMCLPRLDENGRELDQAMLVHEITQNIFSQITGKDPELLPAPESEAAKKIRLMLQDLRVK